MEIKTADVIGLGALGVLYADVLTRGLGKERVRVLADAHRIRRYEEEGVYFNGERCDFQYADAARETRPSELLVVAVKFGGLDAAIEECRHLIGPDTTVISVINGILSEQILGEAFGPEKIVWCVAQKMSAVKNGNQAVCHQPGQLALGVPAGQDTARVQAVAVLLEKVGYAYELPEDIRKHMWGKLICNVGCNQCAMVYECGYGPLQQPGEARDTMLAAMREVVQVGNAEGIALSEADVTAWCSVIDSLEPDSEPSMRQDAKARRKTEVELFAGTIIRHADRLGLEVPVNRRLYQKIRKMEAAY